MMAGRFSSLYIPGVLLLLALAIGGSTVLYAERRVADAEAELASQMQSFSAARQQHANAGLEKDILTRFRGTYAALEKVGFVGAEQRINWVDSLSVANREAKLFGVEYQIGQQEAFPEAASFGVGDLSMRQSVMKVKLPLLHEDDLMRFFRLLAAQKAGVFVMNECDLRRLPSVGVPGAEPNLIAECAVAWITVPETSLEGPIR